MDDGVADTLVAVTSASEIYARAGDQIAGSTHLAEHEGADRYQRAIDDLLRIGASCRYGMPPRNDHDEKRPLFTINALAQIGVRGAPTAASEQSDVCEGLHLRYQP